jgi:hypothetical protein
MSMQPDSWFGRRLLAILRAGALSLAILVGMGFQFSASMCKAQTTNCSGNFIPPDKSPQYFPTGVFDITAPGIAPGTSCLLRAMEEKPLIPPVTVAGSGVYRLTVMPSWGAQFVVRLDVRSDGTGILVKKEVRSDSEPGTLTVNASQEVSKEKVDDFVYLMNKSNFWSMPPLPMRFSKGRWWSMLDWGGILGVLEGTRPGVYHVVTRSLHYKPMPREPYDELTSYLFMDLAHFEIPPIPPLPSKQKH